MKNLFKFPVLVLGLILLLTGTTQKAVAQDDDISLQTFYDELSPYGTWIQDPEYGYVWRPDVDQSDFRPYYSNGRWAMTEYGNTWVSDYDWGWAPFHYGRWICNRFNQWLWIPDTTWGPAWVSWRSGGGYYGWAPLSPGINININLGGGYNIPNFWWVFVPQRDIYYDRFSNYRSYRNVNIINHTTIINNTGRYNRGTYFTGPRRDDIRRATNRDVPVYNIRRSDRSGRSTIDNNTVNIYTPRSGRGTDNRNAAPQRAISKDDYIANGNNRGSRNDRTGATDRNYQGDRTGRTADRSNRENTATPRTQRAEGVQQQRAERVQRDGQNQQEQVQRSEQMRQQRSRTQQQDQANPQQMNQERAQRTERVQRDVQNQQEQAQRSEQNRQQRAQVQEQAQRAEQSRQQRDQVQQQVQAQQQQRAQEQSATNARQQQQRQEQQQRVQQQRQQSEPRQQAQPRQERIQQSAPSRSNESRGGGEARSSDRSARGSRG
jgi:DNA segregation ATPase FtsK/SpoIIIE-like protein